MKRFGLIALLLASRLSAQASQPSYVPPVSDTAHDFKSAKKAALLGVLCPGCGHFYVGDTNKGILFMGVSLISLTTGYALYQRHVDAVYTTGPLYSFLQSSERPADYTSLKIGVGVAAIFWVWGAIDAAPAARRHNHQWDAVSVVGTPQGPALRVAF